MFSVYSIAYNALNISAEGVTVTKKGITDQSNVSLRVFIKNLQSSRWPLFNKGKGQPFDFIQ